ncbi:uncharacterized protein C5L36_0D05900 [Pichia kudriavzevii]|uniref:Trafficking protein particle complex subunit n=1 Tax=Pichia kudriavzevii TaxID=4909 RepID=A0A2U9R8V9_PICKU|nr:uncharacterized protein C5L36_0D05900 [Pichia kudriavzevii]AWU77864.1 hypothetical protein C5L36_0D05900 [Pichia kudriavzevii]
MALSFWIFDRHTECLYHRDFVENTVNTRNSTDEAKLLLGMIHSLRSISHKLAPPNNDNLFDDSLQLASRNRVHTVETRNYTAHILQSLNGLLFVLIVANNEKKDNQQGQRQVNTSQTLETLKAFYRDVWTVSIPQNGMARVSKNESIVINDTRFTDNVDKLLRDL